MAGKTMLMFGKRDRVAGPVHERTRASAARIFRNPDSPAANILLGKVESILDYDEITQTAKQKITARIEEKRSEIAEQALKEHIEQKEHELMASIFGKDSDLISLAKRKFREEIERNAGEDILTALGSIIFDKDKNPKQKTDEIKDLIESGVRAITGDATSAMAVKCISPLFDSEFVRMAESSAAIGIENEKEAIILELTDIIKMRFIGSLTGRSGIATEGSAFANMISIVADPKELAEEMAREIVNGILPTAPPLASMADDIEEGRMGESLARRFTGLDINSKELFAKLNAMFETWVSDATSEKAANLYSQADATANDFLEVYNETKDNRAWHAYVSTLIFKLKLQIKFGMENDTELGRKTIIDMLGSGDFTPEEFEAKAQMITVALFGYDRKGKTRQQSGEAISEMYYGRDNELQRIYRISYSMMTTLDEVCKPKQKLITDNDALQRVRERAQHIRSKLLNYHDDLGNIANATSDIGQTERIE